LDALRPLPIGRLLSVITAYRWALARKSGLDRYRSQQLAAVESPVRKGAHLEAAVRLGSFAPGGPVRRTTVWRPTQPLPADPAS